MHPLLLDDSSKVLVVVIVLRWKLSAMARRALGCRRAASSTGTHVAILS